MMKMSTILLNPNCSELIIRTGFNTKKEVLRELEKIGIKEIKELHNYWSRRDAETSTTLSAKEEDIPKMDDVTKKLLGIDESRTIKGQLIDIDNPNIPDFESHATISVDTYKDYYGDEVVITAHQHCQHQLFPTLKKIEEHFVSDVEGFDGGGPSDYEEWLENGCPKIPNYNKKFKQRRESLIKEYFGDVNG